MQYANLAVLFVAAFFLGRTATDRVIDAVVPDEGWHYEGDYRWRIQSVGDRLLATIARGKECVVKAVFHDREQAEAACLRDITLLRLSTPK